MLALACLHLGKHRPAVPFGDFENGSGFAIVVALYSTVYPRNAEVQRMVPYSKPPPYQERTTMMKKRKFSYSLPPEVDEMVTSHRITADCRSKNEFVEQAIRFYCEYLSLEKSQTIIPIHLQNAIDHAVTLSERRTSKVLFKQAVAIAMLTEVLTKYLDYHPFDIGQLEQIAFDRVRKYNGMLDMKDIFIQNR